MLFFKKSFLFCMALSLLCLSCTQSSTPSKTLLYSANFDKDLSTHWVIEMENHPNSRVYAHNNELVLDTYGGVSVWFNQPLEGDYIISYSRRFVLDGGANDRLSDLNHFWLAKDPRNKNLFTRNGKFEEYADLSLWYMGMGGNYNETTRFRRYDGKGERILLVDKQDKEWLLIPDHEYRVLIIVKGGKTQVRIDGRLFFEAELDETNPRGYFGLRSTFSHQIIRDLKIFRLL